MTANNEKVDDILGDVWDTRGLLDLLEQDDLDPGERERAETLRAAVEPYAADFMYGETVISDDYFVAYAEELADEIGAINKDAGWPNSFIDWNAAADALKQDYNSFEFEGRTWWVR